MNTYDIFYADPDFACETGDLCLGIVEAESTEEAERIASERGMGGVAGVRAVERKEFSPQDAPNDSHRH